MAVKQAGGAAGWLFAALLGLFFGVACTLLVLRVVLEWGPVGDRDADVEALDVSGDGPPPALVGTGVVEAVVLRERVSLVGRLEEVRRVTATAEVEGRVVALPVREGNLVEGGQTVLAAVDPVWATLAVRSAQAELAAAAAELEQARDDLAQLEGLARASSAKEKEVDDQRTLLAERLARVEQRTAERDRAVVQRERTEVVAPFDGLVSRTLVEVGRWVAPGDGVVEVVSWGEIDAVVDAPEAVVNRLDRGADVEVVIDALGSDGGGERFVGRIVSVRPDGFAASRSFPVKVRLADDAGRLKPGMSATAHVAVAAEREHLTVPRSAVLFGPAGAAVWYAMAASAGPGGPAEFTPEPPAYVAMSEPVRVLFGVGDRYAVQPIPGAAFPALTPGTRVVTEGAERLFPAQPLRLNE